MKKLYYLMFTVCLAANVNAKTIPVSTAKSVSENFYSQNTGTVPISVTLTFTETSPKGEPVYYAFNINAKDGFVIVSADDDAHPIIGYSTVGQFHAPSATENPNFSYWMTMRKNEIITMRENHFLANADITNEWNAYINNTPLNNSRSTTAVAQLCHTTWNQSPLYNALCPGGTGSSQAVTGCVATAMAQIMKFWNYPTQGHGSSSYCDCGSNVTPAMQQNYGTLTANYGATTYNWSAMSPNVTSANSAVATIMYHCGVSVQMDYDPNGSSSTVMYSPQNYMGVCARTSYIRYFKYDSTLIHGWDKDADYPGNDAGWITMLENELNTGRPIQYAGQDANGAGGHSWVCDGYDASNNFHMNWGWGGMSDGMFPVTDLSTGSPAFNPINGQQALIGIKPLALNTNDAGVSAVTSPTGIICSTSFSPVVTIKNYGTINITSCTVNYKLDGGSILTHPYTGALAAGATASVTLNSITTNAGTHTLTCYTSLPNGVTDANITNDSTIYHLSVMGTSAALPLSQGFESGATLPTAWSLYNPNADAAWQVLTTIGHTGTHSIGFNNYNGDGSTTNTTGRIDRFYTSTFNFAGSIAPTIKFDVAYGPLVGYADTLQVYYSTNCGVSWTSIYTKSGLTLGTTGGTVSSSTPFIPTSTQWRTETVSLTSIIGQTSVIFAFENRSGYGNWIYVDNINLANGTTGIENNAAGATTVIIYPNPFNTSATIAVQDENGIQLSGMNFILYDMVGKEVMRIDNMNAQTQFSREQLSGGLYFYKVFDKQNIIGKGKVMIQ